MIGGDQPLPLGQQPGGVHYCAGEGGNLQPVNHIHLANQQLPSVANNIDVVLLGRSGRGLRDMDPVVHIPETEAVNACCGSVAINGRCQCITRSAVSCEPESGLFRFAQGFPVPCWCIGVDLQADEDTPLDQPCDRAAADSHLLELPGTPGTGRCAQPGVCVHVHGTSLTGEARPRGRRRASVDKPLCLVRKSAG